MSMQNRLTNWLKRPSSPKRVEKLNRAVRTFMEPLEERQMLSLLGVAPLFPDIFVSTGTMNYNYVSSTGPNALTASGTPQSVTFAQGGAPIVILPGSSGRSFSINFNVNGTGGVIPGQGTLNPNLIIDGEITDPNTNAVDNGILIEGKIVAFGSQAGAAGTAVSNFDFDFAVTGGLLASYFAGSDIGVSILSQGNTFTGAFNTSWSGGNNGLAGVNGNVGPIPPSTTTFTPSITISGTKYLDGTGNGFAGVDSPESGVTIDLFQESNGTAGLQTGTGGDTLVATTTTTSNGTFSFTNVPLGTYYVQEVVPTGFVQTGGGPNGTAGNTYYTVNGTTAGLTYSGNNFDDFQIPTCTPQCVSFAVDNNGCVNTVSDLRGNTQQGDKVTVTFTVPAGMNDQLTLVSYTAPGSSFNSATAYQQQIFDEATGIFTPGTHTLTVLIPNCYYQIDFVCGQAINVLGPTNYGPDSADIFYSAEDRLISADNGGTMNCPSNPVCCGTFATGSFWCTTMGQSAIKCLNGSSNSTCLAQWLATCFPNLYGTGCGKHCLVNSNGTYFTNTQVAAACSNFSGGDQQVLSTALSTYCSSINLSGVNFHSLSSQIITSDVGSGMYSYSVGANGAAFGVANGSTVTVMQLLLDANSNTVAGASVSSGINTVFTAINTAGNW
jgi:Prealbumin-like fold domain